MGLRQRTSTGIATLALGALLATGCSSGSDNLQAAAPETTVATTAKPTTTTTTPPATVAKGVAIEPGLLDAYLTAKDALMDRKTMCLSANLPPIPATCLPLYQGVQKAVTDIGGAAGAYGAGANLRWPNADKVTGLMRNFSDGPCGNQSISSRTGCTVNLTVFDTFEADLDPAALEAARNRQFAAAAAAAEAERQAAIDATKITYQVTGSGTAMVTYATAGFSQAQETVRLPWTKVITENTPTYPSLLAQINGTGTITCRISRGDTEISSVTSSGQYVIAMCSP